MCLVLAAFAACSSSPPRPCAEVDQEARMLRDEAAACDPSEASESCVLVKMSGGVCLDSFKCTLALHYDWARRDIDERFERLERERQNCGKECEYRLCASDTDRRAMCNPSTRRCQLVTDTAAR